MDQAVLDIFAKYDAGHDVINRLERLVGDEDGDVGKVLWQAHRGGHHDCTPEQSYWRAMAQAAGSYDGADVGALLEVVGAHPQMHGLTTGWREKHGWVLYFTNMLEAVDDRGPLIDAWKKVPEPMKSNLGFHLARLGALSAADIGDVALAQVAAQYADHTNWGLEPFDAVWPGEVGAKALAVAAALPDTEIWDKKVMARLLPAATPEQLALAVYNVDYGSVVREMADLFDPLPEGLADALLTVNREHKADHGAHLATILLARAGRGAESAEIVAEALASDAESDFAELFAESLGSMPADVVVPAVVQRFSKKNRSRERWALLPGVPAPEALEAAIAIVKSWPRGDPWERDAALAAFKQLPPGAAPVFAAVTLGKLPQRDILAWGMASSGALDALLPLLTDTSGKVVEAAVHGLGRIEALPQLQRALAEKKKAYRLGAAQALARVPAGPERRALAEAALAKEKNADVKAQLEPLLGEDTEVPHVEVVHEALHEWGKWEPLVALGPDAERALQQVLAKGKARYEDRGWAYYLEQGWPGVRGFALAQLESSVSSARRHAREALVTLGAAADVASLLTAKKAGTRGDAADILRRAPEAGFVDALAAALAREKSTTAGRAIAEALEACEAVGDGPLGEVANAAAGHATLDARFARWQGDSPTDLQGLELRWGSGKVLSERALGGLFAALERGEKLGALRPHLDELSASALWRELGVRLQGSKEGRYGWGVAATGVLAREADLADYGRELDDLARGGAHLDAFARLDALTQHGSSAALQWVDHWARKARSNGLRERAGEAMDQAAKSIGCTRDELAERVLSDFGLDPQGERALSYNGRDYLLRLNQELKLEIRDGGAVRKALPKAKTDEDARTRSDLTALKKQLRSAVSAVIDRLEAAMVEGREWAPEAWQEVFANPVQRRLAEQLVWWDAGAGRAFRVAEDGSFADRDDESFEAIGPITVAHPLRMDDAAAWAELMTDYEKVAPFQQFRRPTVAPDKPADDAIDDWMVHPVASTRVRGFMSKHRWIRGDPQDGGAVLWMSKPFRSLGMTAILNFEPGLGMGYDYEEDQTLRDLVFVSGIQRDMYNTERIRLGEVDPVVYAEVVGSILAMVEAERSA